MLSEDDMVIYQLAQGLENLALEFFALLLTWDWLQDCVLALELLSFVLSSFSSAFLKFVL